MSSELLFTPSEIKNSIYLDDHHRRIPSGDEGDTSSYPIDHVMGFSVNYKNNKTNDPNKSYGAILLMDSSQHAFDPIGIFDQVKSATIVLGKNSRLRQAHVFLIRTTYYHPKEQQDPEYRTHRFTMTTKKVSASGLDRKLTFLDLHTYHHITDAQAINPPNNGRGMLSATQTFLNEEKKIESSSPRKMELQLDDITAYSTKPGQEVSVYLLVDRTEDNKLIITQVETAAGERVMAEKKNVLLQKKRESEEESVAKKKSTADTPGNTDDVDADDSTSGNGGVSLAIFIPVIAVLLFVVITLAISCRKSSAKNNQSTPKNLAITED